MGNEIFLATKDGKAIRFSIKEVREIGRTGMGVKAIKLGKGDKVVGCAILTEGKEDTTLLTVTENGFGKRTKTKEYRKQSRGGKGLKNIKVTEKTGKIIDIKLVTDKDELMLITTKGTLIRTKVSDIKVIGRNTQGVKLIKLRENEKVSAVARILEDEDNVSEDEKK